MFVPPEGASMARLRGIVKFYAPIRLFRFRNKDSTTMSTLSVMPNKIVLLNLSRLWDNSSPEAFRKDLFTSARK